MNDDIPSPRIERRQHGKLSPAILVWLVPILALTIAGWVGWRTVTERGPLVHLLFDDASGIHSGETELRYRDVSVGVVEDISFTETLDRVVVSVRIDKSVAPYLDDDASFWVVQPEVTTRGISGLNTVLSGVYIEGTWDSSPDGLVTRFVGLDRAPLAKTGEQGLEFVLRSSRDGGLTPNTPILYKGVEVGRIGTPQLAPDGSTVEAPAIIFAPHDRLITTATRFWDTSGFSFSLGASGAEIDFSSIASLVSGGVSFETLVSGGEPPEKGARFEVFPDEATARNSVFEPNASRTISLTMVFEQNVSGLETESPVEYNGIRIGEVTNLTGVVDEERFGDRRVRLAAVVEIETTQLGLDADVSDADAFDFLAERARRGVRARLASGSLLTGGLKIEMVELPDPEPADIDLDAAPYPIYPTTTANVSDMAATAEGVFRRLNELPIEELLDSAVGFMNAATALARNEDLQGTPAAVRAILDDLNAVIASDAVQGLPEGVQGLMTGLRGTTEEAQAALADLRLIVTDFREANGPEQVISTLAAAEATANELRVAIEGVPALLEELQGLAAEAQEIPFAELSARLDALLASADTLISDEAFAALPADVSATLAEARRLSDEVRLLVASEGVQGLPAQAGSMLAEAEAAVGDLRRVVEDFRAGGGSQQLVDTLAAGETVAADVSTVLAGVPPILDEFKALATEARSIPFAELSARLDAILVSTEELLGGEAGFAALPADVSATLAEARALSDEIRGLVASEGVQGLPVQVGTMLAEAEAAVGDLRLVVEDFRQAGGTQQIIAALGATETAAGDVSAALEDVPALLEELQKLAADARTIPFVELSARLDSLLVAAEALIIDEEGFAALPGDLSATLADARLLADEVRGLIVSQAVQDLPVQAGALLADLQGAVGDLRVTLDQVAAEDTVARVLAAVDAATLAAEGVGASVEGVPALIEDMRGLAGQAGELPLEQLTVELTATLNAAQKILADTETQSIPASVNATLADLEAILEEVRQGGAVTSANAAFAAAERAADSLAGATGDLPTLIRTANAVLSQANATLASLDNSSEFSREARQALREVQRAAAAVASLARTLERKPNSILLGR